MPRFARVVVPEYPHHITQRGNARRDVFFTPADRVVYLGLLQQYSKLYSLRILGYCIMTNHVHLVAIPGHSLALAKTLREVHGRYAQYRNAIDRSSGHVWQNRYYSCVFEAARMFAVMRYVEMNPVRAGMVARAEDHAWSSAASHLGEADPAGLLDTSAWDWAADQWATALGEGADESPSIRAATYGGRPLGSPSFVARLEEQAQRRLAPGQTGRPRKIEQLAAA